MAEGRVWVFGDDVDTDQIIASQYIILPAIDEMKAHAFESIDGTFAQKVQAGDIIVAGENFGCGSSREQAPGVLKALGIQAVVAKSFARIFFRNSINIGLPVLVCGEVQQHVAQGDLARVQFEEGCLEVKGVSYACTRLPAHMQEILNKGGLVAYLNAEEGTQWA